MSKDLFGEDIQDTPPADWHELCGAELWRGHRSVKVDFGDVTTGLPLSQIRIERIMTPGALPRYAGAQNGIPVKVYMPHWLAKDRGLLPDQIERSRLTAKTHGGKLL